MKPKVVVPVALALVCATVPAGGSTGDSNECLVCHNNERFVIREPDGTVRSMFVDPLRFFQSVHGDKGCQSCHGDLGPGPHVGASESELATRLEAILDYRPSRQRSAVAACMTCHPDEARQFVSSIHGEQAAAGNLDVPLCHDCHGQHYVDPTDDLESDVNPDHIPATCARCHSNALVMARYDVRTNVVRTYETSFHGEKHMLGEARAPVCTSCHGVHDIRSPDDPLSSVNSANAPLTCGRCHEGAGPAFAEAFRHRVPERAEMPVVYWVGTIYTWAILVTVGTMLIWIVLDAYRRRVQEAWRDAEVGP